MAIGDAAQSLASQQEYVRPDLPTLVLDASVLWKRIEKNTKLKPVSNRPTRVPTLPSEGGKFRVGDMDGGDMGVGSGPNEVVGTLSCVTFLQASAYTKLSEFATDSDEKAIEDYAALTHRVATKTFGGYMDAAICTSDGSNTLDTIVSLNGTTGLNVNNANFFQNNQDVDIWTAVGGTFVATLTILTADVLSNTLWFSSALPGTVAAGQKILISGSSGQAGSGIAGLPTYQVAANVGNWMNVQRSSWPGMYITPFIAINGALTPQIVRALQSQMELSMGVEEADESDVVGHCNVDVRDAWEQNALLVQHLQYNAIQGDMSSDMLKKRAPDQIAGREMLVNPRAIPGRLDYLALKNWFRIETAPTDYYSVAGQTLFPIYGASGGLASSLVFYLVWIGQIGAVETRLNAFATGITIPKGVFNH